MFCQLGAYEIKLRSVYFYLHDFRELLGDFDITVLSTNFPSVKQSVLKIISPVMQCHMPFILIIVATTLDIVCKKNSLHPTPHEMFTDLKLSLLFSTYIIYTYVYY